MLKDWNWQTKEAPVANLITTLLKLDDDFQFERIDVALSGNSGFLVTVLNNRQHHHQHQHQRQQYDAYSTRTLLQRYTELLKGLCALPRVQDFVLERAAAATDKWGAAAVVDEQYVWLHSQIQQLVDRGELNPAVLINELKHTTVQVSGAGEPAVNGNYRFSRLLDHNTALYKRNAVFRNKKVTFQIYRCRMDNQAYQWFISIVPAGREPGTNDDEDFYCKPSKFKPQSSLGADLSLSGGGEADVKPPEGAWLVVGNSKMGKTKPPPVIRWVVRGDDEEEEEEDVDEGGEGMVLEEIVAVSEEDDESDREDSMAVVGDDDRFVDDIDDDDI
jgi:hypothetical protein